MVSPLCALGCPGCGPDAAVQVKESPADPSDDRDREPESSFSQENWQGKKNIVPLWMTIHDKKKKTTQGIKPKIGYMNMISFFYLLLT